jgi:hypothetical protein
LGATVVVVGVAPAGPQNSGAENVATTAATAPTLLTADNGGLVIMPNMGMFLPGMRSPLQLARHRLTASSTDS